MTPLRRRIWLGVSTGLIVAGLAVAEPSAHAQDPANGGAGKNQGQAKGNAGASKKKPARRKARGQGAVGVIVPYPMPPVLIIRQTPEAHDEIQALLRMLRYY